MIDDVITVILRRQLRGKMALCEERAEGAYAAMYDARPPAAKDCYDDARRYLAEAIDIARQANFADDLARLTSRRKEIVEVYNRQFRWVGYS
jgi:hypothetical protein